MPFDGSGARGTSDLRAFAHPLRLRLMDALQAHGPLTATEAAERTGTTASNASFHLRVLARHGFVEEAPGAVGRRRPWQLADTQLTVDAGALDDEGRTQLRSLLHLMLARHRDTVLAWERDRDSYDESWQQAAGELHTVMHLTADELAAVREALHDAVRPYLDNDRRPDRLPVAVTLSTLPQPPTAATDPSTQEPR